MDVKLPNLGEGADSGVVVNLLVKEGDRVEEGQTLLELENEKAVAPIPSPAAGTVTALRVTAGDKLSVGQTILSLDTGPAGGRAPAQERAPEKPADAGLREPVAVDDGDAGAAAAGAVEGPADDEPQPGTGAGVPAAAPSIRRLARDLGIDLRRVRGSEQGGRVVMADLRAYIDGLKKLAARPGAAAAGAGARATPPAPDAAPEQVDFSRWGPVLRQPLPHLRRVIGRRMSESWAQVPRVTQFDEADITGLMELRRKYQAAYEGRGARLTLTPFVVRAAALMLKKHPVFNSSLDTTAGELVLKEYYHIGLAVDTDAGLLVPVVRNADKKDLLELAKEIEGLAGRARERKLGLEEMSGGSFTISNQGGIGGAHFTPIVNLPEVAILGLGRGALKPVVREGSIVPRLMLPLAVSYDHRVIDGGAAARFTVDLARAIEGFTENEVMIGG